MLAEGKRSRISSDMKNVQSAFFLFFFFLSSKEKWKRFLVGAGIPGNVSMEILPVTLSEAHRGCGLESRPDKTVSELPVGRTEKCGHQSYLHALL